jgi:ubiquinone/menaquinone biosynthesis C-methylase UbiE
MDYPRSINAGSKRSDNTNVGAVYPVKGMTTDANTAPAIPGYLQDIYRWAYLDNRNARLLDREVIVKAILWGQHNRLRQAAFDDIRPGQKVLQAACVYGQFSPALAQHIGDDGHLEVVDVAAVQVNNCRRKLKNYQNAEVRHQNVMHLRDYEVDIACSYFLLHEVPDEGKSDVANVLLDSVKVGGKAVFVDYHKPHWANPLKYITSLVFETLEPFAKGLWHKEIAEYGGNNSCFEWHKEIYFGGLYQKVVATRLS